MTISFTVYGKPEPQGSIRAFMVGGKPRLTSDNAKLKPWRQQVALSALAERKGEVLQRDVPVVLEVLFCLDRPKSAAKRELPTVKPDLDKLMRAVKDALKGILYEDDSQVVTIEAHKCYSSPQRTEIRLKAKG
jgi:Holliday junction resolvase RusA-like endonuclease